MRPELVIDQMEPRLKAALDLRHEVRIAQDRLEPFVGAAGLADSLAWHVVRNDFDMLRNHAIRVIGEECAEAAITAPETIADMMGER